MEPGACVMQNSGLACAMAACGVTPQAPEDGRLVALDRHGFAVVRPLQIVDADDGGITHVHRRAVRPRIAR